MVGAVGAPSHPLLPCPAPLPLQASAQVQAQVLALLQEWAYMLRPAQFANAYSKLKAKGLPFPPHQPGTPGAAAGAPEAGAQGFEPYPGLSPGPLPPPDAEPAPGPGGGYGSFPQPYPRPQGESACLPAC